MNKKKKFFSAVPAVLLMAALLAFPALADGEYGPGYTGWHQKDSGAWEYLETGTTIKNEWRTIDGTVCYFDADGNYVEGAVPSDSGTGASGTVPSDTGTGASGAAQTEEQRAAAEQAAASAQVSQYVTEQYVHRVNPTGYPDVVEVDITNQHVFCYRNNVLLWESYCVTGCVQEGHNTPEGVFQIQSKERSRYLTGPVNPETGKPKWKNWVEYWMPFHDGCGLHDASWRQKFAGTIYQYAGSHGCVNLPTWMAPGLYDLVYVGMPVVVHQ